MQTESRGTEDEYRSYGQSSIDRPWLNYYPEPFKNVEVPKMTIEAFLRMKNPDQNRYVFEYYGNQFNYEWLWQQVDAAARALKAAGFQEGDRFPYLSRLYLPIIFCSWQQKE